LKFGVKVDEEEEDGYVKQILSHDLWRGTKTNFEWVSEKANRERAAAGEREAAIASCGWTKWERSARDGGWTVVSWIFAVVREREGWELENCCTNTDVLLFLYWVRER
jgi:hypothetical protein